MKMIFVSGLCKRRGAINFCMPRVAAVAGLGLVGLIAITLWAGFLLGERHGDRVSANETSSGVYALLEAERPDMARLFVAQGQHLASGPARTRK